MIVERSGIACFQIIVDGAARETGPDVRQFASTSCSRSHVDPFDVPPRLRLSVDISAHAARIGRGILLFAGSRSVQRQGIANLQIASAMDGNVTGVGARTVTIKRISNATIGAGNATAAIPIHRPLVYPRSRRARSPITEILMGYFVVGITRGSTMDPKGVIRGARFGGSQSDRCAHGQSKKRRDKKTLGHGLTSPLLDAGFTGWNEGTARVTQDYVPLYRLVHGFLTRPVDFHNVMSL